MLFLKLIILNTEYFYYINYLNSPLTSESVFQNIQDLLFFTFSDILVFRKPTSIEKNIINQPALELNYKVFEKVHIIYF